MNIKLIKEKWRRFYKRGFVTGIFVISFICIIDQTLQSPFFFNKIENINIFLYTISFVFFGSIFSGLISLFILFFLSFITVPKK
tara:strand:+ start:349 stop:600 length:252 start_codon:yes stop_codon:yes gene_type:complete